MARRSKPSPAPLPIFFQTASTIIARATSRNLCMPRDLRFCRKKERFIYSMPHAPAMSSNTQRLIGTVRARAIRKQSTTVLTKGADTQVAVL